MVKILNPLSYPHLGHGLRRVKDGCNSEPQGSRSLDRCEIYAKFRRHLNCTEIHMGAKIPSPLIGFFLPHSQLTASKGEILIAFSLYKSRIRNRTSLGTSLYTSSHANPIHPMPLKCPRWFFGSFPAFWLLKIITTRSRVTDRNLQEGFS